jgi:hypothetical protein
MARLLPWLTLLVLLLAGPAQARPPKAPSIVEAVEEAALKAFVDPLPDVAPGALSEVLDLPGGVHLLARTAREPT